MYAKNSTQTLKYMSFNLEQCSTILDTFKNLKEINNIMEVSISYFIKKEKLSIDLAYDIFNYLVFLKKIEVVELSVCCNCGHENYNTNKNIIRCSRCKDLYLNNDLNEKFRLRDW